MVLTIINVIVVAEYYVGMPTLERNTDTVVLIYLSTTLHSVHFTNE